MANTVTTELGAYVTTVPFYRNLYIASTTLTSNDVIAPLMFLGVPAHLRPIIGAKAIYRLIADGIHVPTFSSDFKKTYDSLNYNTTEDVVNLIEFSYDGADFRYKITPEVLGIEYPRWVGDYGLGDDIIHIVGTDDNDSIIQATTPSPSARRSVYNLLKSLHYTGRNPILYSISEDGINWTESLDPKQAYIIRTCPEVGDMPVYVKVREYDTALESNVLTLIVNAFDQEGRCGG
jgi:hypothetical protein